MIILLIFTHSRVTAAHRAHKSPLCRLRAMEPRSDRRCSGSSWNQWLGANIGVVLRFWFTPGADFELFAGEEDTCVEQRPNPSFSSWSVVMLEQGTRHSHSHGYFMVSQTLIMHVNACSSPRGRAQGILSFYEFQFHELLSTPDSLFWILIRYRFASCSMSLHPHRS